MVSTTELRLARIENELCIVAWKGLGEGGERRGNETKRVSVAAKSNGSGDCSKQTNVNKFCRRHAKRLESRIKENSRDLRGEGEVRILCRRKLLVFVVVVAAAAAATVASNR